jgi:hypothetical protein
MQVSKASARHDSQKRVNRLNSRSEVRIEYTADGDGSD